MISDADRAAITAAVDALDVSRWAPLSDAERDLVSRALAAPAADAHHLEHETSDVA